jgi:signal transduction histidine kinase
MAPLEQTRRLLRSQVHDLKSPLNAVAINFQLLYKALQKEGGERELETARILRQELARLTRFLEAFVHQVAPPELDQPELEHVDLRRIVRGAARIARPSARHARIRLRVELPATPMPIEADAGWLEQALLHVLLNAIEAQPAGGEIRITLKRESGRAEVVIEDDGPGIPEPLMQRVFDPHYTTKEDGRGAGLPVARSFVEARGGRLTLAGRPGGGITVRIEVPAQDV